MLAAIGAAMLLVGCNGSPAEVRQTEYAVTEVETRDVTFIDKYPATIKGRQDVEIFPQVSGRITDIKVREGQRVRRGQTLNADCPSLPRLALSRLASRPAFASPRRASGRTIPSVGFLRHPCRPSLLLSADYAQWHSWLGKLRRQHDSQSRQVACQCPRLDCPAIVQQGTQHGSAPHSRSPPVAASSRACRETGVVQQDTGYYKPLPCRRRYVT